MIDRPRIKSAASRGSAASWPRAARDHLLRLRRFDAGWGYRAEGESYVEPTVLACLALRTTSRDGSDPEIVSVQAQSSTWLSRIQQPDGSVGLSAAVPSPGWPTSYAILLWSTLGSHRAHRERAVRWLHDDAGRRYPWIPESPVGHDTTIDGWPWLRDTHAFVEPTALAILALLRAGAGASSRITDGYRLLRDRATARGGWNYGTSTVYGKPLDPQPGPTGLALLAMAADGTRDRTVRMAIDYLAAELPRIRTAQSLSWAILGLTAWGRRPPGCEEALGEAYPGALASGTPAFDLAHLLLAVDPSSPELFVAPERS